MEEKKYLKWYSKGAYGMGLAANQGLIGILNTFILLYFTSIVGLNPAIVGTVMLVSKVFDGITDLCFGYLIDRTHSKLGKARPWVLGSILPLVLCFVLLFSVPVMSATAQYVYVFIIYTLMNAVCLTISQISCNTLAALITKNGNERVNANAIGFIIAAIIQIASSSVMVSMVNAFGGGAVGWRAAAIVFAVIFTVMLLICVAFCKEVPEDEQLGEKKDKPSMSFLQGLKYVVSNKYFWIMLFAMIGWSMFSTVFNGVSSYYAIYTLGRSGWIGLLSFGTFLPVLVTLIFVSAIVKRFGMYRTLSVGTACSAVISIILAIVGGIGGASVGIIIVILHIARGFFHAPFAGLQVAIMADVAAYTEMKDHVHIEGSIYSCTSIASKVGSGVGSWLLGVLIAASGYVEGSEVQTAAVASNLNLIFVIVPSAILVFVAIFAHFLRVDKIQAMKAGQ